MTPSLEKRGSNPRGVRPAPRRVSSLVPFRPAPRRGLSDLYPTPSPPACPRPEWPLAFLLALTDPRPLTTPAQRLHPPPTVAESIALVRRRGYRHHTHLQQTHGGAARITRASGVC